MNYTKGEWKAYKSPVEGDWVIEADTGETIELICRQARHFNVNLLAAAPDTYEALKDIIEQAERTLLPIGVDLAESIGVFGKQALAKAESKGGDRSKKTH